MSQRLCAWELFSGYIIYPAIINIAPVVTQLPTHAATSGSIDKGALYSGVKGQYSYCMCGQLSPTFLKQAHGKESVLGHESMKGSA